MQNYFRCEATVSAQHWCYTLLDEHLNNDTNLHKEQYSIAVVEYLSLFSFSQTKH